MPGGERVGLTCSVRMRRAELLKCHSPTLGPCEGALTLIPRVGVSALAAVRTRNVEVAEVTRRGPIKGGLRFQSPDADPALGGRAIRGFRGVPMTTTPDQPTELELLRRLMTKRSAPVECELIVGGLPAALADEVPLPAGARLVGSMVIGHQGLLADLQVVLDATGNPTEVVNAFERELRERGWDPFEGLPGLMHGGFRPGPAGEARMLRRGGQGPVLRVSAWAMDGALTDLRLWLDWQMPQQSEERGRNHLMEMPGLTLMPRLHSPEGMALETQGSGGGGGRWNSEAWVDTDLTVAEWRHTSPHSWSRADGPGSLAALTT